MSTQALHLQPDHDDIAARGFRGTPLQEILFAPVACQRGGCFERGAGFLVAAELVQQVAADASAAGDRLSAQALAAGASTIASPAAGPSAMPTATARLSSMTGERTSAASCA